MENTQIKNNILWIDIAKFIGIFLVIFHHTTGMCENGHQLLYKLQAFINFLEKRAPLVLGKGLKNATN